MPNLTSQQQAAADAIGAGSPAMVRSVAGSGKTTTLVQGTHLTPPSRSILALAFNKSIQVELDKRTPDHVECKTMNGLGHRAWAGHLRKRLSLDPHKMGKITSEVIKQAQADNEDIWPAVRSLAAMAKINGIVPKGNAFAIGYRPDSPEHWQDIADEFDITFTPLIHGLAREVLKRSFNLALQGEIDFDDQIVMPLVCKSKFQRFEQVLVDEAQDLNFMQHQMIQRVAPKTLVAVGDPNQAIYGWRGALGESMDLLGDQFKLPVLDMSTCFRCSQTVIAAAQEFVPRITARDGAPVGSVTSLGSWRPGDLRTAPNSMIICRNIAPMVRTAIKFLKLGFGATVKARDIGESIARLIKKLAPDNDLKIELFFELLQGWADNERAKAMAKGRDAQLDAINDKVEAIHALAHEQVRTVGDLQAALARVFSADNSRFQFTTGHGAKGLEWPTVYWLDPWLVPSKFALERADRGDPSGLDQEWNLAYVITTRAQEHLVKLNSKELRED